jgi:hypothetical protein
MALISIGCFEKLQSWLAAGSSTHRSKVAEEMLLCEVIVQRRICPKHHQKHSLMRRAAGLREASLRQLPTDLSIFKRIFMSDLRLMSKHGMTRASLCREMYTRICEENGPADPVLQGIVSRWRSC